MAQSLAAPSRRVDGGCDGGLAAPSGLSSGGGALWWVNHGWEGRTCCTPAQPLRETCVLRGRSSEPCCGACAADYAHLTRSSAVVHADFNVALSVDSVTELPE